ncbi:MAG: putative nucleotidyltransferase [Patescibacteria group bacterium]|jgi:predicted nucleotidyltransferase
MEHKNYKAEIVNNLRNEQNHIRGLAKELGTNQTTIARKVKELEDENVIDYQMKGKNKTYHLKKTIEAMQYLYIVQHYNVIEIVKKYPILRSIIEEIQKEPKIDLAILFGSYAKQTAHNKSDIDIFIQTQSKVIKKQIEQINSKLQVKMGALDNNTILGKEIQKNHIILKGSEQYYENE